ncbi:MAG: glycoside hydrolase family 3 N-terminal domain-containing protein [Rikenellaceae bacterium]
MRNLLLLFSMIAVWSTSLAQDPDWEAQADEIIAKMTLEEKVSQMVNATTGVDRLGILPYDWWNEALHGVARSGKATIFPQAVALAATFDQELVHDVANAISDEARAKYNVAQRAENYSRYTGLTFWSPNVNIFRDPRWGRGQETYGEDPYLTGKIGVAYVKGMQGDDPNYLKTAACAKHFAVHSGPEALRHSFDATPTKKDLFETYLPAFEMLVKEGDVESVMGAYNRVYGHSASASHYLLTEILREQWGFEGHILSDCGAIKDIYEGHAIATDAAEASAMALNSGLDLNCGDSYLALGEAVERGLVYEDQIDDALRRLFVTKLKLGMLGDSAKDNPYNNISEEVVCCDEHTALARKCAVNSMVLISNKENTLPLAKNLKRVGVTGAFAADNFVLMGNYFGVTPSMTSFLEGVVDAVDLSTRVGYAPGIQAGGENQNPVCWIDEEVTITDACIVSIGISANDEGEEGAAIASKDIGDRLSMEIPAHHIKYLKDIRANCKGKLIAVVSGCSGLDLREVVEVADAVILTWYPGQEGGAALADIIFGDVSPSGRLPITFPASADQLPPFEDYSMQGRTYRYMTQKPQYTFGYGLSYTTFDYRNLEVTPQGSSKRGTFDTLDLRFTLNNSGQYASDEVVQAYITIPNAGVDNPLCSLVAFDRVSLEPSQSTEVTLSLNKEQIMAITESGEKQLLPGEYIIRVGNSSPSERSAELGGVWVEERFSIDSKGRIKLSKK